MGSRMEPCDTSQVGWIKEVMLDAFNENITMTGCIPVEEW